MGGIVQEKIDESSAELLECAVNNDDYLCRHIKYIGGGKLEVHIMDPDDRDHVLIVSMSVGIK